MDFAGFALRASQQKFIERMRASLTSRTETDDPDRFTPVATADSSDDVGTDYASPRRDCGRGGGVPAHCLVPSFTAVLTSAQLAGIGVDPPSKDYRMGQPAKKSFSRTLVRCEAASHSARQAS